jgi:hypothetical protein
MQQVSHQISEVKVHERQNPLKSKNTRRTTDTSSLEQIVAFYVMYWKVSGYVVVPGI